MSRRVIWLVTGVGAIVVAVLVALSLGGREADATGDAPAAIVGVERVKTLMSGVQQQGSTVGRPDAPVQIAEYGDLACPACAHASKTTVPELIRRYVRTGRVRMEFRPIAFLSESSERGARGIEAAAEQDAAWTLAEVLYRNQGDERSDWLTDGLLERAVTRIGLDLQRWRRDYRSAEVARGLETRTEQARSGGVRATPTFVVRGPEGERIVQGAAPIEEMAAAIDAVVAS